MSVKVERHRFGLSWRQFIGITISLWHLRRGFRWLMRDYDHREG